MIIDNKTARVIQPLPGFTPQIGQVVSMMNWARYKTLQTVQGLTVQQLDYRVDGQSNSIGALLEHIASTDIWYQLVCFKNELPNDESLGRWKPAAHLGEYVDQIKGHDLDYHLSNLHTVRSEVLSKLTSYDDQWLYEYKDILVKFWELPEGTLINNYWCWFHTIEDEIRHCGQIVLIKKKIKELGI